MKLPASIIFLFLTLVACTCAASGDTLRLSLAGADSMLIRNNLSLIAASCDIDIAKAQAVQAKLFSNPVASTEIGLYNPDSQKWFDIGGSGNITFALEQVFQLAGQRNTAVKMYREGTRMSEAEYADLVRTLKYQVHQSFFTVWYLSEASRIITRQLELLEGTIRGYKEQYGKGNISLKDYSRLEAAYLQLSHDKTDITSTIRENMKSLKILLGCQVPLVTKPGAGEIEKYDVSRYRLPDLVTLALANRPDLQVSESRIKQDEFNLSLQKRMAVPDLAAGLTYDQRGNYVKNYNGLTLSMPLPVFNRNRGNIMAASALLGQSRTNYQLVENTVRSDVETAWGKVTDYTSERSKTDPTFIDQVNELSSGIIENYRKKNISLLEFTDLFEAYSQAVIDYYQLTTNWISACEELNYAEGTEVFK